MSDVLDAATLVAITGPVAGQVFRLDADELVIGRDGVSALTIPDASISRRHCALRRSASGWSVHDLQSANGTLVNGELALEHRLRDGDRLRTGGTEFLFRCQSPRTAPPSPEVSRATTRLPVHASRYFRDQAPGPPDWRIQRDLQALVRIGRLVHGMADRVQLETELLRAACDVVPALEAAYFRLDPGSSDLKCICTRGGDGRALPVDQESIDLALSRREAVLSSPPGSPPDVAARGDRPAEMCVLAVPVFNQVEIAGLLYLATPAGSGGFDDLHLELASAIAGIGSVALMNVCRLETLRAEADRLKRALNITHEMRGGSPAMEKVYRAIAKVAPTDATVLITGETGTGKELAARAIHANSARSSRPFVAINCAAVTETLLESELFGHERGAFSGAVAAKQGLIEAAHGGTLFLDEVGELSPALQAKLLRVLQHREFQRVGGTKTIRVDIRLIAATNRRLDQEVRAGRFREDLLYRLKVIEIEMPALRQRREDIPLLVSHFLERACERYNRPALAVTPSAERRLVSHDWPGNVRELENAIDRAVIMTGTAEIEPDDLPEDVAGSGPDDAPAPSTFHEAVLETKRRIIREALERANGQITETARLLGLHPNYLHRLLNSLGLRARS